MERFLLNFRKNFRRNPWQSRSKIFKWISLAIFLIISGKFFQRILEDTSRRVFASIPDRIHVENSRRRRWRILREIIWRVSGNPCKNSRLHFRRNAGRIPEEIIDSVPRRILESIPRIILDIGNLVTISGGIHGKNPGKIIGLVPREILRKI